MIQWVESEGFMNAPESPHSPSNTTEWCEYLKRYDRFLDLYERSVEEHAVNNRISAESTRISAENIRLLEEQARNYQEQVASQRRVQIWGISVAILFGLLIALGLIMRNR
jgi:hypothetical protein